MPVIYCRRVLFLLSTGSNTLTLDAFSKLCLRNYFKSFKDLERMKCVGSQVIGGVDSRADDWKSNDLGMIRMQVRESLPYAITADSLLTHI